VGTSSGPYTLHDTKGLLGVNVNVNVVNGVNVSCIDNRKFDYKNNNLLSNSSFQANQEVNRSFPYSHVFQLLFHIYRLHFMNIVFISNI